jgi:hypothetical protein
VINDKNITYITTTRVMGHYEQWEGKYNGTLLSIGRDILALGGNNIIPSSEITSNSGGIDGM